MTETNRTIFRLDQMLRCSYFLLLISAAIAGGIVTPWAIALLALSVIALTISFICRSFITKTFEIYLPNFLWPLLAFILLASVQSYALTDEQGARQSLSLNVEATRNSLFVLIILVAAFLLGANIFKSSRAMGQFIKWLIAFGFLYSFFSLTLHFAWQQNLHWFNPAPHADAFGTFVNRNHFAGYIELLFPLPVAFLLSLRSNLEKKILYIAAAITMGIALCFSLSRGGMMSFLTQILLLFFTATRRKLAPSRLRQNNFAAVCVIASIIGLIVLGIYLLGANPVILRFGDEENRAEIWRNSFRIFHMHPLLGTGVGTFETAFPIYANDSGFDVVAEAHSDYLQVLTDTGLLGLLILLTFFYCYFVNIRRALQTSQPLQRAIALGSSISMAGILVHSCFDFNLQLPSHALLFLLHGAFCASSAQLTLRNTSPKRNYDEINLLSRVVAD